MPDKEVVSNTRVELTYTMEEFKTALDLPSVPLAVYSQARKVIVVLGSEV